MIPGEIIPSENSEMLIANDGLEAVSIRVCNTGDRPVQVGSHFHFFEVNESLHFERQLARGKRLNIPSGTAVRFEPGDEKEVSLVPLRGKREVFGLNCKINGSLED